MTHRRRKASEAKPRVVTGPRLYPVIRCVREDKFFAVSHIPLEIYKNTQGKVSQKASPHCWDNGKCQFLEGYFLDMSQVKRGDLVTCPHCGSGVDFMAFPSSTIPGLQ